MISLQISVDDKHVPFCMFNISALWIWQCFGAQACKSPICFVECCVTLICCLCSSFWCSGLDVPRYTTIRYQQCLCYASGGVKAPKVTPGFCVAPFSDCGVVWSSFWCMAVTLVPPMSTLCGTIRWRTHCIKRGQFSAAHCFGVRCVSDVCVKSCVESNHQ